MKMKKNLLYLSWLLMLMILMLLGGFVVYASELMPNEVVEGSPFLFERYEVTRYMIDYVDDTGWNVGSKVVGYILYSFSSIVWTISLYISKLTSFLVGYAYQFNLTKTAYDLIGTYVGRMFGFEKGVLVGGFLGLLLKLSIIIIGSYVAYVGLVKRKTTLALVSVRNYFLILITSIVFFSNASTYIGLITGVANHISSSVASVGLSALSTSTGVSMDSQSDVSKFMQEMLFTLQVRNPWKMLEYGSLEVEEERVSAVEGSMYGTTEREQAIKRERDEHENVWVTSGNIQIVRFVNVFFLFLGNTFISFYVLLIVLSLLLTKFMMIVFVFVLPFFLVVALLPNNQKVAIRCIHEILVSVSSTIVITLVLSVSFMLSSLVQTISTQENIPYIICIILQSAVFYGCFKGLDKIVSMIGFSSGEKGLMASKMLERGVSGYMRRNVRQKLKSKGKPVKAEESDKKEESKEDKEESKEEKDQENKKDSQDKEDKKDEVRTRREDESHSSSESSESNSAERHQQNDDGSDDRVHENRERLKNDQESDTHDKKEVLEENSRDMPPRYSRKDFEKEERKESSRDSFNASPKETFKEDKSFDKEVKEDEVLKDHQIRVNGKVYDKKTFQEEKEEKKTFLPSRKKSKELSAHEKESRQRIKEDKKEL